MTALCVRAKVDGFHSAGTMVKIVHLGIAWLVTNCYVAGVVVPVPHAALELGAVDGAKPLS
eukprot:CAMPEP_0181415964 /NCGR_PEP_ID=MMETSP1110-20121109/10282_1 /TAXON_ID=174948 /ORGANISM="Symbiodinium sp., Strain CCMP421" /LENGTH=60 /DNA_ID=CAMNT_0023538871 /DNA_START=412 /DNA_END=591 /DNA_ORIENTATION=-